MRLPKLLDNADTWLVDAHGIGFRLRRWALKIMSLFILTLSHRLRNLLERKFPVQVLTPPTTTPYRCNLSSETIQVALDAALAGTSYLSADWDEDRKSFIEGLLAGVEGGIKHVEPCIGVSKLSCIMCSHYIRAWVVLA